MSVSVTTFVKPVPISGCRDKWYWTFSQNLLGDGSGGTYTIQADFASVALFGGHWLFDVRLFSLQINDYAGGSTVGQIAIFPRQVGTDANGLFWRRGFELYTSLSMGCLYGTQDHVLPRFKFKPDDNRNIVGAPLIDVSVYPNTNTKYLLVELAGYIYNEKAESALSLDT